MQTVLATCRRKRGRGRFRQRAVIYGRSRTSLQHNANLSIFTFLFDSHVRRPNDLRNAFSQPSLPLAFDINTGVARSQLNSSLPWAITNLHSIETSGLGRVRKGVVPIGSFATNFDGISEEQRQDMIGLVNHASKKTQHHTDLYCQVRKQQYEFECQSPWPATTERRQLI